MVETIDKQKEGEPYIKDSKNSPLKERLARIIRRALVVNSGKISRPENARSKYQEVNELAVRILEEVDGCDKSFDEIAAVLSKELQEIVGNSGQQVVGVVLLGSSSNFGKSIRGSTCNPGGDLDLRLVFKQLPKSKVLSKLSDHCGKRIPKISMEKVGYPIEMCEEFNPNPSNYELLFTDVEDFLKSITKSSDINKKAIRIINLLRLNHPLEVKDKQKEIILQGLSQLKDKDLQYYHQLVTKLTFFWQEYRRLKIKYFFSSKLITDLLFSQITDNNERNRLTQIFDTLQSLQSTMILYLDANLNYDLVYDPKTNWKNLVAGFVKDNPSHFSGIKITDNLLKILSKVLKRYSQLYFTLEKIYEQSYLPFLQMIEDSSNK
jgi:hypothetical protein